MEWLKHGGCTRYDLHGINPKTNERTFPFKSRLAGVNGREVNFPEGVRRLSERGVSLVRYLRKIFKGKRLETPDGAPATCLVTSTIAKAGRSIAGRNHIKQILPANSFRRTERRHTLDPSDSESIN
jgi:hypothetical protein